MNNFPATLALKFKPQKSRITTIKQIFAKDLDKLTKLSSSNFLRDKFSEQKRLVAKQRRDKLIFRKSQKVSFLNTQKLINKQNSNDNIVATSQSLNNQTLPSLRFKSSGIAVRALQRLLVANGYSVPVDGVFGAVTESAVKAFQAQKNLKVDGIVGLQTWDSLTMYNRFATVWS
ncbi:peptidoglycan-binding domain-containing protein [Nostoc sp. PCC 7524]|uniref:peptidoglycan-binding domain-containing protein n=1 Tax=Nostoc sp. (strain ATCC 29411 / PCC 7524) TaxID=28072 RepID=UPI0009FC15B6|nr:peptidoglycan-binding domain-containing protein [Nostoc sp. PCC 7524]